MSDNTIHVNSMTKMYRQFMKILGEGKEQADDGFEAMKENPEYEEQVLKSIRANFSFVDHFHSMNYSVLHFGTTEEESYGRSFGGGNPMMEKEEGFWERRAKRREKLNEQYEEMMEKKALAKRLVLDEYYANMTAGGDINEQMLQPLLTYGLDILEAMEND